MSNNLPEIINPNMPSTTEFQMLQVIAKNAEESGLYGGVGQKSKILMILLAARELGISPMLALNGGIWNIQGKIEISSRLMNGMIRRAGHSIKVIASDETKCTLLGTRSDGDSIESTFTIEDAAKAGLASRDVWKKYPADMLYNRCMSRLARKLFPDVIGTAYVEGEIREAKEEEKKLAIADYEDVTPQSLENSHKSIPMSEILNGEPKINEQQLMNIVEGMSKVDETFLSNYTTYMQEKWGATAYIDLPMRAYSPTMEAIKRNIEMNALKQVNNADYQS